MRTGEGTFRHWLSRVPAGTVLAVSLQTQFEKGLGRYGLGRVRPNTV